MAASEAFERLARSFMAEHPEIRHAWRQVPSLMWSDRTDLVCETGSSVDVWATLRRDAIAVGAGEDHVDFEDFGREISDEDLAAEAFHHFTVLLGKNGFIEEEEA